MFAVTRADTFREYLDDHPESQALLERLRCAIAAIGPTHEKESKSQVTFRRRRTVALAWAPGQYLGEQCAPLVLTLVFPERDTSPRWKEVVQPRTGIFTHHLELHVASDIDDQVQAWIRRAYSAAE